MENALVTPTRVAAPGNGEAVLPVPPQTILGGILVTGHGQAAVPHGVGNDMAPCFTKES